MSELDEGSRGGKGAVGRGGKPPTTFGGSTEVSVWLIGMICCIEKGDKREAVVRALEGTAPHARKGSQQRGKGSVGLPGPDGGEHCREPLPLCEGAVPNGGVLGFPQEVIWEAERQRQLRCPWEDSACVLLGGRGGQRVGAHRTRRGDRRRSLSGGWPGGRDGIVRKLGRRADSGWKTGGRNALGSGAEEESVHKKTGQMRWFREEGAFGEGGGRGLHQPKGAAHPGLCIHQGEGKQKVPWQRVRPAAIRPPGGFQALQKRQGVWAGWGEEPKGSQQDHGQRRRP